MQGYLVTLGNGQLNAADPISGNLMTFNQSSALGAGSWTWSGTTTGGATVTNQTANGNYVLGTDRNVCFVPNAGPVGTISTAAANSAPGYNDTVFGTNANNTAINGNGDADVIYGGVGTSETGTGNDTISAGAGNDTIYGDNQTGPKSGPEDFNWTLQGGNGTNVSGGFTQDTGGMRVTFAYQDTGAGTAATINTQTEYRAPGETLSTTSGLALSGTGNGPTSTVGFSFDAEPGSNAPTPNGDGTFTGVDELDLSGMTSDYGTTPVTVNDVVVSDDGNGNAVLTFPGGESLTLIGVSPAEVDNPFALHAMGIPLSDGTVSGTAGADLIDADYEGDPDGDNVDRSDAVLTGNGPQDDLNEAGSGADTVFAGAGDDLVYGEFENDTLYGRSGDDTLHGLGSDTLYGGAGNDTNTFADGDFAYGGDGDDLLILENLGAPVGGVITVVGGEDGESLGDTLQLGSLADMSTLIITKPAIEGGGKSGTITLDDDSFLSSSGIENIICFTPGTRIATPRGARPVEGLRIGDMVVTRDHGLQPIRWIGKRTVPATGRFAPVRIRPGVVTGLDRDLVVSPQHRMLFQGYRAQLLFGESEVLVAAAHLIDGHAVTQDEGEAVTYIHIMFDDHEIIYAEGAATESFHPGDLGLSAVADAARAELFDLLPALRASPESYGNTARRCLLRNEAQLIRI